MMIDRNEIKVLVQEAVREILTESLGIRVPPKAEWLDTASAIEVLRHHGITTADELLRKRRSKGWFEEGVHWRIANTDIHATGSGVRYDWNVSEIKRRLETKHSKLKF
jgi:hypothetical protein